MLTILKSYYDETFANPQYNVCLLGLQGSGKTKLHTFIKKSSEKYQSLGTKHQYKPTVGLNVAKMKTSKGKLCLWDLGGSKGFRKIWQQYYHECHGLIFFIDDRVLQGFNCLLNVLFHPDMLCIPILIIASTGEVKSKVQKQIEDTLKQQKMQSLKRKIKVDSILNEKNEDYSSNSKIKIGLIMNWLYDNILDLNRSIKSM